MKRTVSASLSMMISLPSCARYPSGGTPPIHIPFCFEAAILSRMRSPMTSRSNCAKDNRTLRVKRPIEVVVLNCCVTETKQHQVERTAGERLPTRDAARGAGPQLALDAPRFQLVLQQPDRAEFGIAAKDEAHDFRLAVDDDELAVLRLITERRHPAHPHPLLFRGGDLVADALADDLPLELCEGQQNVEG